MRGSLVEWVEEVRAAERHQYGTPLSVEADARIQRAMARGSRGGHAFVRRAVGAVAIAILLLSMRALSIGGLASTSSTDIGDAALIEAGVSRTIDWSSSAGGPRELP
jgi:hypothetical protein